MLNRRSFLLGSAATMAVLTASCRSAGTLPISRTSRVAAAGLSAPAVAQQEPAAALRDAATEMRALLARSGFTP